MVENEQVSQKMLQVFDKVCDDNTMSDEKTDFEVCDCEQLYSEKVAQNLLEDFSNFSDDVTIDSFDINEKCCDDEQQNSTKVAQKLAQYLCEKCNYKTSKLSSWKSHLSTQKHLNGNMNHNMYKCSKCNYNTSKHSSWIKHLATLKHCSYKDVKTQTYDCWCGKKYKNISTLSKHKKFCKTQPINFASIVNNIGIDKLIEYLLKESAEFKQMFLTSQKEMMEYNAKIVEMVVDKVGDNHSHNTNNSHNTNHITNKNFNLNFFLNETCKDSMNIDEFVNTIKVTLEDLENTGEQGYVEGISNIFIKNLNELENHLRPLHCSDSKREVIYIKSNNQWIKEMDDKPILTKAIKSIAHKNIVLIKEWTEKYPDCVKPTSNKNDTYLKIVSESMNGFTTEESNANIRKVISNISQEATIDKKLYTK
jgi:hypothetical protein